MLYNMLVDLYLATIFLLIS